MLDLVLAAAKFQRELDDLGLPNCVIGGLALQAWGEVRVTRDADFTVLTGFQDEAEKARIILDLIVPRMPHAFEFALEHRVLLGFLDGSIAVDIALGGYEYEGRAVERAKALQFNSISLRICIAEDLIVYKVFAGRERDWLDVEGILIRQSQLNWNLIEEELEPLLQIIDAPERLDRLRALAESKQSLQLREEL